MLTAFDGFNKWVHEDWGLNYKDRIFAVGYITLADVDWALDQLDWMIERDLRVINMRPASVPDGNGGRRSLGHPAHDPFWKKMNQYGITLAMQRDRTRRDPDRGGGQHHVLSEATGIELVAVRFLDEGKSHRCISKRIGEVAAG